jgi:hypothetical protein
MSRDPLSNVPEEIADALHDDIRHVTEEVCGYFVHYTDDHNLARYRSCTGYNIKYKEPELEVELGQEKVSLEVSEDRGLLRPYEFVASFAIDSGWGPISATWAKRGHDLTQITFSLEVSCAQIVPGDNSRVAADFLSHLTQDGLIAAATQMFGPLLDGERLFESFEVPAYQSLTLSGLDKQLDDILELDDPAVYESLFGDNQEPGSGAIGEGWFTTVTLNRDSFSGICIEDLHEREREFLSRLTNRKSREYLLYLKMMAYPQGPQMQHELFARAYLDILCTRSSLTVKEIETAKALLPGWEGSLEELITASVALVSERSAETG